MKVLITNDQSIASIKLAYLLKSQDVLFGNQHHDFPKANSESLAHEVLKFCMDHQVTHIYPMEFDELTALLKAKVLFNEFDINVMVSKVDALHHKESAIADSFSSLSTKILSLGYPDKKIALVNTNDKGNMILLDDETKDFTRVWQGLNRLSFVQLGKLFNQPNFVPVYLYIYKEEIKTDYFLVDDNKCIFFGNVNNSIKAQIKSIVDDGKFIGFYQIDYDDDTLLRIKNAGL